MYTLYRLKTDSFISVGIKQEDMDFIKNIKHKNVFYNEKQKLSTFNFIEKNMSTLNVVLFCMVAYIFKIPILSNFTMRYIERHFTMVAGTQNFMFLDFLTVKRILRSSELHLTSEVQVFNAVNEWISCDIEERSKFAISLLSEVRLSLLSKHNLKSLLRESYIIWSVEKCREVVEKALVNNEKMVQNHLNCRYNSQSMYDFVVFEEDHNGKGKNSLMLVDGQTLKSNNPLALIGENETMVTAIALKGELHVIVNSICKNTTSIKKLSLTTNMWEHLVDFDYRKEFCACALINSIFIIGGRNNSNELMLQSCLVYDTKNMEFIKSPSLKAARFRSACAVFLGRVVVSGGLIPGIHPVLRVPYNGDTDAVEVCEGDRWSEMPRLVERNRDHGMVAVKNKLFVIGDELEVFDDSSEKFVLMRNPPHSLYNLYQQQNFVGAVSMANKIFVLRKNEQVVLYDVDKEEWFEMNFEAAIYIKFGCCLKLPQ